MVYLFLSTGEYSFGRASRITATTSIGNRRVSKYRKRS